MKLLRRPARAGLPERLDALAAAVEDGDGRLPAELLDKVRSVVERAGQVLSPALVAELKAGVVA